MRHKRKDTSDVPSCFPRSNGNKNEIVCVHQIIEIIGEISVKAWNHTKVTGLVKDSKQILGDNNKEVR